MWLSSEITWQVYKNRTKQEILPWDEQMDSIILGYDEELFYTANAKQKWQNLKKKY